jgi:hypothetical protein
MTPYYEQNKERLKDYQKKWTKENEEYYKEQQKKYREKNREYLKEYHRQNYQENVEQIKQLRRERNKNKPSISKSLNQRYDTAKKKSQKRNRIFDITFEQYESLIQPNKCHYCNSPLNKTGTGLDRKDNKKGYSIDNVVPCCARCNTTFMDNYQYEERLILAESIRKIDEIVKNPKL